MITSFFFHKILETNMSISRCTSFYSSTRSPMHRRGTWQNGFSIIYTAMAVSYVYIHTLFPQHIFHSHSYFKSLYVSRSVYESRAKSNRINLAPTITDQCKYCLFMSTLYTTLQYELA